MSCDHPWCRNPSPFVDTGIPPAARPVGGSVLVEAVVPTWLRQAATRMRCPWMRPP